MVAMPHPSPLPRLHRQNHRQRVAAAALPFMVALAMALVPACGQPMVPDYPTVDGQKVTAPVGILNQVTLSPPKGWKQIEPHTWALPLGQDRLVILKANLATGIDGGAGSFVDKQLQELGKNGQGGTESDERLVLGDLDARLIKVVDLRNRPPMGLWMVAADAEDGLFTLTVLGPLDDLRKHAGAIDACLASLRIAPPVGVQRDVPKRPPIEDDLVPPDRAKSPD